MSKRLSSKAGDHRSGPADSAKASGNRRKLATGTTALALLAATFVFPLAPELSAQAVLSTSVDQQPVEAQLRADENRVNLSLEEAVEIALQRNLNLIAQRYVLARSEQAVEQSRSIFDLGLSSTFTFSDEESQAQDTLQDASVITRQGQQYTAGLQQLTTWGGTASLSLFASTSESNNLALFNPSYIGALTLDFQQPLLRDFGKLATRRTLILAQTDQSISRERFEQEVINTVRQVEEAYWRLVQARKQLEVSRESLDLAKELHERNRIKVEVGTLAPFELVQSEAGIASREGDIIRDQASVGDSEDTLRRLLNLKSGGEWGKEIYPETEAALEAVEIDLNEAIRTAIENRSELRAQQLELEKLGLDAQYFANQIKPDLTLGVNYRVSGFTGDSTFTNPDTGETTVISQDIFDPFDDVFGNEFPEWSATLTFRFPLQNRNAKAQKVTAELALEEGEVSLSDLQQQVVNEVRSAVRQLEASSKQVEAASAARRAQDKSLEAERKRFDNGMSTSFQVLQVQEQLTAAQSSEVQAITNYRLQKVEYLRSLGQLLSESGIEINGAD